ncbi:ABC transporter substrate-binding protein [Vibrio sp. CAIM 722]|uniref:ABC transporter substrate-binding protein n=1 Tax=Vibrio eleionomae TaxID=2653505 RepID=A0A7X4LHF4_9VIBR|nr:ABC transporter substrate-binding protein [Vibrio eleionomae]MZI92010.1 ABC transporter substrate-binding protein [Vibrio eleionomae]
MNKRFVSLFCAALLCAASSSVFASRTIVDQIGRTVTVPDQVNRVVVLQHQTLDLLMQLDAKDKIVGVLSSWKKHLGADVVRLDPQLPLLPMPGDLTQVNIESLLKIHPQVVFVTNYAPPAMIQQITDAGIPVVAISLRKDAKNQANKMNASMTNEEQVYNEGLKQGIRLIGNIVNKDHQAEDLIKTAFADRAKVAEHLKAIPDDKRIRVYMANPNLTTYGSGKYTGLMMQHAGAENVAAKTIKGYQQVSIENVMKWNPEVIFVQSRYPHVVDEINHDPRWQAIDAVKEHHVYLMPEYAKAWGYPTPEAMALGEMWMAKKLYPTQFKDIDMSKMANGYYLHFYHTRFDKAPRAVTQ